MADLYREQRVFQHEGDALIIRICFERLSDGHYAVANTEFVRESDDLQRRLSEITTRTAELMLDPEQPGLWDFRSSLESAVIANDDAFSDLDDWISNAQNK